MLLTEKGQITIPQDVLDQMDLRPGDTIVFVAEGDKLVGYPTRKRDSLREAAGTLGNGVKYVSKEAEREAIERYFIQRERRKRLGLPNDDE